MKYLVLLFVLLIMNTFSSSAQAYFSATPLDQGSYEVPKSFSGTWKVEKYNNAGQAYTILVNPNKKGQVNIVQGMGAMTPAIISRINDNLFMSLYEVGGPGQPAGFYIYYIDVKTESEIRLTPVRYDLEIPRGQTVVEMLQQPGLALQTICFPQNILLTNTNSIIRKPLDTAGRRINITTKG